MFYFQDIIKEVELHPKYFGRKLTRHIEEQIQKEVEGSCSGKYGYIVVVYAFNSISQGRIREGGGCATFTVNFKACCMRPFKNEVLQATVDVVNKVGFFCTAGPLKIFVSNYLIPEEFEFQMAEEAAFVSSDDEVRIKIGCQVRVRVVGVRIEANDCTCVASMKDDYLGVVAIMD
ncbi:hypothetical protein WJX73_008784 [Symbiochloris irregularis]|uniref:DNA-directed RNA polymerase II subunit RPB7 n=1 Tax=Symbiochloris irregularis TaxID=706552 RepID=A0AAW1PAJ7_9CHLO